MTDVDRHPLADRIEAAVDALPDGQQLGAARDLLLAPDGELEGTVKRVEAMVRAA
ncbi:hypothetical protein [Streptomyces sp. WMMC897]|uniref:hypothetical protein n=1 Tax=Streptomyces sp. WMMC897 TaxID=3014782 RepID=UPI0022B72DD3|nr:hypothetical protein [Streptomyces sp. WMMC897]MCZ7413047.1 hypothetical protein [Streptomyces sp. WMMC897]MCZ7413135.1 hypothetical protein [Streptomyces sp. WMMC897]MCZ7415481.1 hypothetical protein [Streptomyces sp. WMMC897]